MAERLLGKVEVVGAIQEAAAHSDSITEMGGRPDGATCHILDVDSIDAGAPMAPPQRRLALM